MISFATGWTSIHIQWYYIFRYQIILTQIQLSLLSNSKTFYTCSAKIYIVNYTCVQTRILYIQLELDACSEIILTHSHHLRQTKTTDTKTVPILNRYWQIQLHIHATFKNYCLIFFYSDLMLKTDVKCNDLLDVCIVTILNTL